MTLPGKQDIQIINGTDTTIPITGEIIIINYDVIHRGWNAKITELKPKVIIMDECHYIKNSSALRTKAVKEITKGIPHVIALTGTPIINRPIEAFNTISIIDKKLFPNWWTYVHSYCDAHHNGFGWDFSGAINTEELHDKLVQSIMLRRKKKDVLTDLPDKLYSYIPIELDNQKEYEIAEADFISYLAEVKGADAAKKAKGAEHLVKIEALKQLAVKGKLTAAIEWIRDFTNTNGNKLVVFTTHKITVDALINEFKDVAVKVDGSVSTDKRDEAVQAFQENPQIKLFVGNIRAAGTGITLTTASSVAFLELPWTPGELAQAEDRCHRIGQKDTVNVYYLLASETIEEKIAALLDSKRKILDAVLDGTETAEESLLTELMKSYEEKEI
jgi:SNF2 family DNA or RNA helicase